MIRLLRAELVELRATRTIWTLAASAVVASVAFAALQLGLDTDPATGTIAWGGAADRITDPADVAELVDVATLVGLVAVVLGALALPTEFRYQTITSTFLAAPSRLRILAAKALTVAALGAAIAVVAQAATLAVTAVWLTLAGADVPLDGEVARILLLTPLAAALAGALGVGVGAVARQQVTAVLVVVAWALAVEQLVAGLLPDLRAALPFTGALSALGSAGNADLAAGGAALVLAGYTVAALAAGAVGLLRRDLA